MVKYFLFGHYDSRGGATLISAASEIEARAAYVEINETIEEFIDFALEAIEDPEHDPFWDEVVAVKDDREAVVRMATEADFLHEVQFESYRVVEDGEDLEYIEMSPEGDKFEEKLQWDEDKQKTTPNPHSEMLWWNEGTKTLRLCPAGEYPGAGWERSDFGEDACGVVVMNV